MAPSNVMAVRDGAGMSAETTTANHAASWAWVLQQPSFGYATPEGEPRRPTTRETLREVWQCIDAFRDATCWLALAEALFTVLTWLAFFAFFGLGFSWAGLLVAGVAVMFVGTVTNTVWLHRYCSHRAFGFRYRWLPRALCWLNALGIA